MMGKRKTVIVTSGIKTSKMYAEDVGETMPGGDLGLPKIFRDKRQM